jgi:hypothetical protein
MAFGHLKAGVPARSQCTSERSCDRWIQSRFFVVFLHRRVNTELAPQLYIELHASVAVLLIHQLTNFVSLSSVFDYNEGLPTQISKLSLKTASSWFFRFCLLTTVYVITVTLPSWLPTALPCHEPIFIRITSGHCLRALQFLSFSVFW